MAIQLYSLDWVALARLLSQRIRIALLLVSPLTRFGSWRPGFEPPFVFDTLLMFHLPSIQWNLIGDDEHAWDSEGICNLEGGCYAKTINLAEEVRITITCYLWMSYACSGRCCRTDINQSGSMHSNRFKIVTQLYSSSWNTRSLHYQTEPDIYRAIKTDAMLENVVLNEENGLLIPDYFDVSKTQNGRVSYPIFHIDNYVSSNVWEQHHYYFLRSYHVTRLWLSLTLSWTCFALYMLAWTSTSWPSRQHYLSDMWRLWSTTTCF